jgi:hypothetical protein
VSRPHIPVAELREQGFLQEANRLFFHPCGLALEARMMVDGDWTPDEISGSEWMQARVYDVMAGLRDNGLDSVFLDGPLTIADAEREMYETAVAVCRRLWPAGSQQLSGVQDLRDDPEGIIFGEDPTDKMIKAESVKAERMVRWHARAKLWNGGPLEITEPADVEPVGWVAPPGTFG